MIFVLQIVTYETTKEDGIVEILTETKSATPMAMSASSKVTGKNSSKKNDSTVIPVRTPASEVVIKQESTDGTTVPSPRRRPLPMLIPIVDKQQQQQQPQRNPPTIIRLSRPSNDMTDTKLSFAGQITVGDLASSAVATAENGDRTDNSTASEHNQQQHLFVDTSTTDVGRRSSSSAGSSSAASPKSKTASFFDKLKAQVDETVNLTCPVCRHESKCLSEYMRHKLTHKNGSDDEYDDVDDVDAEDVDDDDEDNVVTVAPTVMPVDQIEAAVDRRACVVNGDGSSSRSPPPVTAAELKSTRCQRCRKRCKTSTELVTHLATCWGPPSTVKNPSATVTSNAPTRAEKIELDDGRSTEKMEQQQRHHPMENKIFVWNTPVVGVLPHEKYGEGGRPLPPLVAVSDPVGKRPFKIVEMPPRVHVHNPPLPPLTAISSRRPDNRNATTSEPPVSSSTPHQSPQHQQQQVISVRKEGKMYKTVSFILLQLTFFLDIV